jgi:hypothetical protein
MGGDSFFSGGNVVISFIFTCPVGNASSRELARFPTAAKILVAGALFCLDFLPGGAARPENFKKAKKTQTQETRVTDQNFLSEDKAKTIKKCLAKIKRRLSKKDMS